MPTFSRTEIKNVNIGNDDARVTVFTNLTIEGVRVWNAQVSIDMPDGSVVNTTIQLSNALTTTEDRAAFKGFIAAIRDAAMVASGWVLS